MDYATKFPVQAIINGRTKLPYNMALVMWPLNGLEASGVARERWEKANLFDMALAVDDIRTEGGIVTANFDFGVHGTHRVRLYVVSQVQARVSGAYHAGTPYTHESVFTTVYNR